MPQRHKGNRVALTIRLPFDLYREVAIRARGRNWSMSDYVSFCVAKELSGKYRRADEVRQHPVQDVVGIANEWIEELNAN